jgi:hypothetical protein
MPPGVGDRMSTDGEAIERDLHNAVADVLAHHETSMVTKWIILVEVVDEAGDRGMWTFTSPGATAWDSLGMLTYATQMEQAQHGRSRGADDDG